ncbi:MAG: chorismate synthase [Chloroflexi bacterium 13_1_40CM_4_68_4]|nr:MAG: chorismate synthase [Chloroflexi bacterium 13_1_40CM_4_68_4]
MGALRFLTAGESHGPGLVTIVEGMPAGVPIAATDIDSDLMRRQRGYGRGGRQKIERDAVRVLAGIRQGRTIGSPIAFVIENRDAPNWERVMSVTPVEDAPAPVTRLRPGHADLAGALKHGYDDVRDVIERASARETAARTAAGGVAKALLRELGIAVHSEVTQIGEVRATPTWDEDRVEASEVRCSDEGASTRMIEAIEAARRDGDTLGGVVAVRATGVPPGLGSYAQWDRRLDGRLAQAVVSIPSVKAMAIGDGAQVAAELGSAAHDPIEVRHSEFSRTRNRAGGLEGGVTNGEHVVLWVSFKPISTLMKPLPSADLATGEPSPAHVERSDICVVPAGGVVCEAVVALILADAVLEKFGNDSLDDLRAALERYRSRLRPLRART